MLSHQQILHFRTFGYVTLHSRLLSPAEAATLRQEVRDALTDTFGQTATEPDGLGGISGDYLPLAASRAPFSPALIDPVTVRIEAVERHHVRFVKPARCRWQRAVNLDKIHRLVNPNG